MHKAYEVLLLGRFIQGIGVSGPKVITRALVRDLYEGAAMARIMSFVMVFFILVPLLAPALGQGIMILVNWQGIFAFYLVMAVIMMFWLGLRQPETLAIESRVPLSAIVLWKNGKRIIRHRRIMACTAAAGLIFGGQLLYLSLAPTLFFDLYGVTVMFPLWFALLALSIGFTSFLNGKLVMRLGMYRLSMFALITQVVLNVVFLGICVVWEGVPPFVLFMILTSLSMGCLGMLFGNINAMAMQSLGRVAGLGASLVASMSSAVAVGVTIFWGHFYDQTLYAFVLAFLSAALVSMVLMVLANKSEIDSI